MQAWLHLTYEDEDDAMLLFIRKGVYLGLEGRNVDGEGNLFPQQLDLITANSTIAGNEQGRHDTGRVLKN